MGGDHLLERLLEECVTGEYDCLGLRLSFTAHCAIDQDMERPSPWLQWIESLRRQRKTGAAVLPGDAGLRQDNPGAEFEENALDHADGTSRGIDHTQPNRVATDWREPARAAPDGRLLSAAIWSSSSFVR